MSRSTFLTASRAYAKSMWGSKLKFQPGAVTNFVEVTIAGKKRTFQVRIKEVTVDKARVEAINYFQEVPIEVALEGFLRECEGKSEEKMHRKSVVRKEKQSKLKKAAK